MAINQGFYNIVVKKEIETEPEINIDILNHDIKQEAVDDYEEYPENINNVVIKEELIIPDVVTDYNLSENVPFQHQNDCDNNIPVNGLVDPTKMIIYNAVRSDGRPCKIVNIFRNQPKKKKKKNKKKNSATDGPQYLCVHCGKSFNAVNFKNHMKTHEKDQISKKLPRRIVGPSVISEPEPIKNHVNTYHEDQISNMVGFLDGTQTADRSRPQISELKTVELHMKTHEKNRISKMVLYDGGQAVGRQTVGPQIPKPKPIESRVNIQPENVTSNIIALLGGGGGRQTDRRLPQTSEPKPVESRVETHQENQILCPHCGESFDSPNFESHLKIHEENRISKTVLFDGGQTDRPQISEPKPVEKTHEENQILAQSDGQISKPRPPRKQNLKVYSSVQLYACCKCCQMFPTVEALGLHSYIHFQCTICSIRFKSLTDLQQHKAIHNKFFKCGECDAAYDLKKDLDFHWDSEHKHNKDCEKCKKLFFDKKSFRSHLKTCGRTYCKTCGAGFPTGKESDEHVCAEKKTKNTLDNLISYSISPSGDKVYECGLCRKEFHVLQSLRKHLKTHRKNQFRCANCRDRFKSQMDLDEHRCRYDEEEEFSLDDLKQYQIPYNRLNLYECAVCRKKCTADAFILHLSTHSQEELSQINMEVEQINMKVAEINMEVDSPDEPFKCFQCQVKFDSEEDLKSHIRFHNDKPPYKCNKCGKKNFTLASLRSHLIKCMDAQFYKCGECKELFVQEKHLTEHYSNSHANDAKTEVETESSWRCQPCKLDFPDKQSYEEHLRNHPSYRCDVCRRHFKTTLGFEKHKMVHTVLKPFYCEQCPEKFHTGQGLKFHMSVHLDTNMIACYQCGLKFSSPHKLLVHAKSHPDKKCFKCDKCQRLFVSVVGFENHKKKCSGKMSFKCDVCHRFLLTEANLTLHKNKHTNAQEFECGECHKKFMLKRTYESHLLLHTGDSPFKCEKCGKMFGQRSALTNHLYLHSQTPFECGYCERQFFFKRVLAKHMMSHTVEKLYACELCDLRFKVKGNMKKHLLIHSGARLFECYKCKKRFTQRAVLSRHLDSHIPGAYNEFDGKEKNYACEECHKKFRLKHSLKNHYIALHSKAKPFECFICNKKFTFRYALTAHSYVHYSLKKVFKCYVCRKRFQHKASLTSHLMSHGRLSLYKCDRCKRKFFTKSELSEHIAGLHSNNRKMLKCNKCGIRFESVDLYRKHSVVHSEGKSLECCRCKRKFAFEIGLETHMLTHLGSKTYECKICKGKFKNSYRLKKHFKKHSPDLLNSKRLLSVTV